MDLSTRNRKTLAQLPPFKAASSSQAFFSSTAYHHLSGASADLAASTRKCGRENIRTGYYRRGPSSTYNLNFASERTSSDCGGSNRRSSKRCAMQPVVHGESLKNQKIASRPDMPICRRREVPGSGNAQGPAQTDFEAMVEADLEADIAREIEVEIAKEILYLSQRLATLHSKQELRRVACGERSKMGHSCPQTPLECASSPAEPATGSAFATDKEKQPPESKKRSVKVVAVKFLQSTAESNKGVQYVDPSSRKELLTDSPFLVPVNLPRSSLGTPARLLASSIVGHPLPNRGSPDRKKSLESRSRVSVEEYVRERSSADKGSKSKSSVLKAEFQEDLETSRLRVLTNHNTSNLGRPHQDERSLSMGSAVKSRYFPEFERKIDWVKTLRSETLNNLTAVPLNPTEKVIDGDSVPEQFFKDKQSLTQTWFRENYGSVEAEETTSSQEIEREGIHPFSSNNPVQRHDQSSGDTPRLERSSIQQQLESVSLVAPSPNPTKAAWPCTTPTPDTPSSAAHRSFSPSVRARTVPGRYATALRANSKTISTSHFKCDPKLVKKTDHASRSAGKEARSSTTKERALVTKSTIRNDYPGLAVLMSKGDCGDACVHCRSGQHHHRDPTGKARDNRSTGGSNECTQRKDNFKAEYEKFVESSEILEKQVSELYHAAVENGSAAETSAEVEVVQPKNGHYSSALPATKHTFIRCIDLIKDKSKPPFLPKGIRPTGQSVLPPVDEQDSDDSVLARSLPRTDATEQDLEWEFITDEKTADEQGVKDTYKHRQTPVSNGGATASMVELPFKCEETLIDDKECLPKLRAECEGVHQLHDGESPCDSGWEKRTVNQHQVHPSSEFSRSQSDWHCSYNGGLWADEIELLDLESFWCLVGELEGSVMVTRS